MSMLDARVIGIVSTSNWVSRLFLNGPDEIGIEKMRSQFFQSLKSSGVPVTQPRRLWRRNLELKKPTEYINVLANHND